MCGLSESIIIRAAVLARPIRDTAADTAVITMRISLLAAAALLRGSAAQVRKSPDPLNFQLRLLPEREPMLMRPAAWNSAFHSVKCGVAIFTLVTLSNRGFWGAPLLAEIPSDFKGRRLPSEYFAFSSCVSSHGCSY